VGGGRQFTYATDEDGRRVPARRGTAAAADERPALVVAGESIAAGFGLDYEETFAALAARALDLRLVDVAEGGYGPDQAYLRLADALSSDVVRPAAVVTVFVPAQLGRILRDDRPRLVLGADGALGFQPAADGLLGAWRLRDVVHNRLPYASDADLARATATTAAVLRATAVAARARGAAPLFVVVSLGPPRPLDAHPEAQIVRALFVDQQLPFVRVDLDGPYLLPGDGHPSPRGARRIADAVVDALGPR
jgi:hypothetical protein